MEPLKLIALETEDLAVISAALQDAVVRLEDMTFLKGEGRFAAVLNRFAWETGERQRRRTGLDFARVTAARVSGIDLGRKDAVLNLLAIRFIEGEAPSGTIELTFSGDVAVQLDVECIEARLKDMGGAWQARLKPRHPAA